VFHARTIEGLARLVKIHQDVSGVHPLIHPYRIEGDRPPLFSHGGSEDLGRFLGAGQPLYWLDPHGMNGLPIPDTIEAMAADYLQGIRLIQPSGPYYLLGYSLGGLVMFEVAHQLLKQGEQVALLVLIDPSAPYDMENAPNTSALESSLAFSKNRAFGIRSSVRSTIRNLLMRIRRRSRWTNRIVKRLACELWLALGYRLPPFIRLFYFLENAEKVVERYRTKVYPGSFVLFRRPDNCCEAQWRALALGAVEIHDTWVDHNDFLEQPYVQILAGKIRDYLQRDQAGALS
jgi:thioesterase domain-containing protein